MKASNANVIAQLSRATEGLIYSCAGDSLVGTFVWEVAETKEILLRKLPYSVGAIGIRKSRGTGFPEVDNILQLHSANLRRYQFMGTSLCWLGETKAGDWLGVTVDCYND